MLRCLLLFMTKDCNTRNNTNQGTNICQSDQLHNMELRVNQRIYLVNTISTIPQYLFLTQIMLFLYWSIDMQMFGQAFQ